MVHPLSLPQQAMRHTFPLLSLESLNRVGSCRCLSILDVSRSVQVLGVDFSQAFIDAAERMRKGEAATCTVWDDHACTCRQRHSEAGHIYDHTMIISHAKKIVVPKHTEYTLV